MLELYTIRTVQLALVALLGIALSAGVATAICNGVPNGVVDGDEDCDDHNSDNGDGCSSSCTIETGWTCEEGETCNDLEQNQDETDIDCGGTICAPCGDGEGCDDGSDCASGVCSGPGGTCLAPACDDGVQNGDETDLDCGGTCDPCSDGGNCSNPWDCESGVCTDGTCAAPACSDGVTNGDETDLDCGGSCPGCENGQDCSDDSDCGSGSCAGGTCGYADCQQKGYCVMFVTSTNSTGNLGGLAGADSTCNTSAGAAGLCGGTGQIPCNFQAWMCDGITAPADRSTKRSVNYVRTDLKLVAAGWADLTDGTIHNPINRDEHGNLPGSCTSGCLPWTYVKTNGTCDDETYLSPGSGPCPTGQWCKLTCADPHSGAGWNTGAWNAQGSKGDMNRTDSGWTDGVTAGCNTPAEKHYCIEQ